VEHGAFVVSEMRELCSEGDSSHCPRTQDITGETRRGAQT